MRFVQRCHQCPSKPQPGPTVAQIKQQEIWHFTVKCKSAKLCLFDEVVTLRVVRYICVKLRMSKSHLHQYAPMYSTVGTGLRHGYISSGDFVFLHFGLVAVYEHKHCTLYSKRTLQYCSHSCPEASKSIFSSLLWDSPPVVFLLSASFSPLHSATPRCLYTSPSQPQIMSNPFA